MSLPLPRARGSRGFGGWFDLVEDAAEDDGGGFFSGVANEIYESGAAAASDVYNDVAGPELTSAEVEDLGSEEDATAEYREEGYTAGYLDGSQNKPYGASPKPFYPASSGAGYAYAEGYNAGYTAGLNAYKDYGGGAKPPGTGGGPPASTGGGIGVPLPDSKATETSEGLSTGAKVAIGVGAAALVAGVVAVSKRPRRRGR